MGRKQRQKKQKKVKTSKTISRAIREKEKNALYYIIYIGLLILLLYPPYFRGMFFDREFLPTHIFSGILFFLYIIYKSKTLKEHKFFYTHMDYAFIALVVAYFLSIFVAVNTRTAVGEFLKYINYFIAFYMVSDFARSENNIRIILWTMILSAFGVAFIGIGAAAGTFTYRGAFVSGRINSTVQYPNTLAAYLTAAFMLTTALWVTVQSRFQRSALAFINYTLFICFLFTLSRGAWLLFPAFFLILVLGMPSQYRMKVIGYSFLTFISAVLASPGFALAISAKDEAKVWLWYIAGGILAVALFYITEKISERFAFHIKPKAILTIFIIFIILGGIGAYTVITTEEPLTLSHSIDEEESNRTSSYPIKDVKPDTEYTLRVTLSATPGKGEDEWGALIYINSISESKESVRIHDEYIDEHLSKETKEMIFRTRPDTRDLSIAFRNRYPGTEATIYDVEIHETQDMASARRIIMSYKYIPKAISRRLESISTEESSFTGRMRFYKDALKIIKDHPVIGTGGGGWKTIYKSYQSSRYFTTEVHNFFLQLWVETGTIGLLAFASIGILALITTYKTLTSDITTTGKVLTWGAFSGVIALTGHSAMDFNLSLGGIALYLWQLFGVLKSSNITEKKVTKTAKPGAPWALWPLAGMTCVFVILSSLLYQGYTYGQKAVERIEEQDIMGAKEYFEKAAKFDPYTASYKADLAQIDHFIAMQTEDEALLKQSEDMRLQAIRLDPYNASLKTQLAAYYLEEGKISEGISQLEEATKVNPFNTEYWENLSDAYYKIALIQIQQDQKDQVLHYTKKAQNIPKDISGYNQDSTKSALEMTNRLFLDIYRSKLLAENIHEERYYRKLDSLVFASDFTLDVDNDEVPDLWRISNSKDGLLQVHIEDEGVKLTNPGGGTSYLDLKKDITLYPKETYRLNLLIGSKDPENNPIVDIRSRKGKTTQHQLKNLKLKPELTQITTTFTTTEDIEEGTQWLRIRIPENTQEPVVIKSMELWLE